MARLIVEFRSSSSESPLQVGSCVALHVSIWSNKATILSTGASEGLQMEAPRACGQYQVVEDLALESEDRLLLRRLIASEAAALITLGQVSEHAIGA
jgi:hypothetical protein